MNYIDVTIGIFAVIDDIINRIDLNLTDIFEYNWLKALTNYTITRIVEVLC